MKTILLLVSICFLSITSHAQILKNQWILNTAVTGIYTSYPTRSFDTYELNTPIGVGYFLRNKWALGLRGAYGVRQDYTHLILKDINFNSAEGYVLEKRNQFTVGPFTRYYFLPKTNKFNVYGEVGYSYGRFNSDLLKVLRVANQKSTIHLLNANIAPVYFINEHIALEFILSYVRQSEKGTYSYKTDAFLYGLGLQVYLNKRKQ